MKSRPLSRFVSVRATQTAGCALGLAGWLAALAPLFGQVNVLTHRNDFTRAGQNTNETTLTPANVNSNTFGKLFSYALDGDAYAQPLYVSGVAVPGQGVHNIVFAVTQHNGVYAFDADSNSGLNGGVIWQTNLGPSSIMPNSDFGNRYGPYHDITPEVGITGTPVIDLASGTLYLNAFTHEGSSYVHRLHALNITNGTERPFSPVVVTAAIPATGVGSLGGVLPLTPTLCLQRSALTLAGGLLYLVFTGYADTDPYHGWILGYNKTNFQQLTNYIFNTTPNSTVAAYGANAGEGGIWMAGNGLAVDSNTNLFFMTGNGVFNATNAGGTEYGDCFIRLSTTNGLSVADYFSPFNQSTLASGDTDLGSGGCILLPDSAGSVAHPHLILGAGKEGKIYLLDRDALGHFNPGSDPQIVQSVAGQIHNSFCTPAYFNGRIYYQSIGDNLKAFTVNNATLSTAPVSQSAGTIGFPGASPAVSANGTNNAIVWVLQNDAAGTGPAILHAYDAYNLAQELYNSSQAGNRDTAAKAVKTTIPTVANGKVYVGGRFGLTAFGNGTFLAVPTISPSGGLFTNSVTVTLADATPGVAIHYTLDNSTPTGSSPVYAAPFVVTNTTAVKMIALKSGAVPSTIVAATFINSASLQFAPGFVKQEFYSGATRANLEDPGFVTAPDSIRYLTSFETPSGQGSGYAERVSGYFVPPQTTNYVFYVCSDDDSDLFLSTDASPANKHLIAQETVWSNSRQWLTSGGGSVLAARRSDQFAGTTWPGGNIIQLNQGTRYYLEGVHHQGSGGDAFAATFKVGGAPDPANGDAPRLTGSNIYVDAYNNTLINVSSPPQDAVAVEGSTATFAVGASAGYLGDLSGSQSLPILYQWASAPDGSSLFANIPGATAAAYITPPVALPDSGTQFRAALATAGSASNSPSAKLFVIHDSTPPLPVQVQSVSASGKLITVLFSKPLETVSAQSSANYVFSPGNIAPSSATLDGTATIVTLTTAVALPQSTPITLAISGLKDQHGNFAPAGAAITFSYTVLGSGGFAQTLLQDSPLGYWRLNEASGSPTAVDAVGAHNGSYASAATAGGAGPRPAAFAGFEATNAAVQTLGATPNSYVSVPFGSLGTNNVTFTAWVYPVGTQDTRAGLLITRGNGTSGGMGYGNGQTLSYTWNNNSSTTYNFASGLVIPSNQWSMVAMVIYPDKAILYLANTNGLFSATNAIAHTADVFGNNWQIGHDNNSGNNNGTRTFNGFIDEAAVFNKSIAPDRIAAYYQAATTAGVSVTNLAVTPSFLRFTSITIADGQAVLQWTGTGTLEEATNVTGPWTTSQNQNNPSIAPMAGTRFFRLRR